ncbi:MAG: DUF3084 domain-containing protein [Armatimonadetes bacterium]|nr:DUF3084 domain-containing protein [Candidatus Hippobium faecium]
MIYSVFVFVLLIIISGGIAYLGDYIGRYLGKKRLSVFGLRPKHTAIVTTVVTGMVISFAALMFLTLINKEFKEVVFHGQKILKNNTVLETKSLELSEKNKKLTDTNKSLSEEHKSLSSKNSVLEKATELLENKNRLLSDKAESYQSKALGLQKKSAELEKKIKKLLSDYKNTENKLHESQKAKTLAETEINLLKSNIKKQQTELAEITEKSDSLGFLLNEKQKELELNLQKLEKEEKNLADIEVQLKEARVNLDETLKSLEVANAELQTYTELRLNDVIIRQDDEIIRGVIENNLSLSEIKDTLYKLVAAGDLRCSKIMSKVAKYDNGLALAYKSENGEILLIDFNVLIDQAAQMIKSNKKYNTLVIISSAGNFTAKDIEKEPVVAQIRLVEDKMVYRKGSIVTNKYFDGKMTEPYVFSDVYEFLNVQVPDVFIKKGVVFQQKILLDNESKKLTDNIQIQLNLTRKIRTADSMCLVDVIAKNDIYSHNIYSPNLFDYEVKMIK